MTQYRIDYGDEDNRVTETIDADQIVSEDGVVVFFKGDDAVLRVNEEHLHNGDELPIERT
ncbi:hypothetical protein [Actinomadura hibisca]|uniref:hypothetical protein n=1 Tax=Actinomadura hibisca TaxID=68565 RepID=UPI0008305DDA|nr:hypothetical protein [Actinomadura hibisca]